MRFGFGKMHHVPFALSLAVMLASPAFGQDRAAGSKPARAAGTKPDRAAAQDAIRAASVSEFGGSGGYGCVDTVAVAESEGRSRGMCVDF